MKKFQSIIKYSGLSFISAFVLLSCEDDDICTDEGEVPRLVADMYYTESDTPLEDTIYYWSSILKEDISKGLVKPTGTSEDTVQINHGFVTLKSSFGMPIQKNNEKKMFYTIAQGKDKEVKDPITGQVTNVIKAKRDRLILEYGETGSAYTSKGCGFGLTFKEVKVNLVTKSENGRGNWINNIETVNTEIKDGSTTIIKLFADSRD